MSKEHIIKPFPSTGEQNNGNLDFVIEDSMSDCCMVANISLNDISLYFT